MNIPVFDFHCDTALAMLGQDLNSAGCLAKNEGHIDLERASTLAGYAQCFACFTTDLPELTQGISPIVIFERELATIQREISRNSRRIAIAYDTKDIEENRMAGKMSAILTLEGTAGIGFNPELLEDLSMIGFRVVSLSWNERNPLTGSNLTGGGLTDLGREFVKEAQRVGMLVDVSHISDEGFWDIMKITDAPIIATHSNSRSLCPHSRNLTDDMFRAIRETGGVAGYNMCDEFTAVENPTLDDVCNHLFHFLELDPSGKGIALGGDLDGVSGLPAGFSGVEDWPKLSARLLERGMEEQMVRDIFWNNAMGVMNRAVRHH